MDLNNVDLQYNNLCKLILEKGVKKEDRTGTGTISYFGHQMRFDLSEGFPLLTGKKVPFRIMAEELLWFLSGSTNVKDLQKRKVKIWDADYARWVREGHPDNGDLGPIYPKQWRNVELHEKNEYDQIRYIDQIQTVIESIENNPDSRRHIVSSWNVSQLELMALPPCHTLFQFYVADGKLSCQLYQRSGDLFLGVPLNIASYALLTHMIAQITGLEVGEFIHTFGDVHIYNNHIEQVKEQISREPKQLPTLWLDPTVDHIDNFKIGHIMIKGYDPHPTIKGEVSAG